MFTSPFDLDAVSRTLTAAVDAVASLEGAALAPDEATDLAVLVSRSIDRLGGELARLSVEVEESGEWSTAGATSAAAHLSNSTGMAWGSARRTLELGRALETVPALERAVRSGDVSPAAAAKVVPMISEDWFDDAADALLAEMTGMTPTEAERHVAGWRAVAGPTDEIERRRTAEDRRSLTFRPLGDGMTHIEGSVPNRVAQSLRRTLKHLADQQRLDESARTVQQRRVDALGDLVAAYERGEVTGGRNLPRLIATMTLDDLEQRSGVAIDESGDALSSAEIDRLCCDAVIHRYVADQTGAVLNFGRGRRTVSPQQYLALVARDGGCRHPACDRPAGWCEAHHLREFAARGGLTNLDELVLLCHHHHHALHDSSWTLTGTPQHLVFTGPDGRRLDSPLPRHIATTAA